MLAKILIGFVVGTLIGLTGVGGGVLLLPMLIFGLRVPPIIAVGSDALFNFFTKIPSSLRASAQRARSPKSRRRHGVRQRSRLLSWESVCSVHLRTVYGNGVNDFIKSAVGLLLIIIPTLLMFQGRIEDHLAGRPPTMKSSPACP